MIARRGVAQFESQGNGELTWTQNNLISFGAVTVVRGKDEPMMDAIFICTTCTSPTVYLNVRPVAEIEPGIYPLRAV